jgi:hypothetical protein
MDTAIEATVSQLSQSLSQAAQSQRALLSELALYARDESLRFSNLRQERNSQAMEKFASCASLPSLIGLQQEWLRDLMQDYAGQNTRLAAAWRGVAGTMVSEAKAAAGETAQQAEETLDHAQDIAQDAMHETGEQMADLDHDANNTYVQH